MNSPICPNCGSRMLMRKAKKGRYAGNYFWGCGRYPHCRMIVNIGEAGFLEGEVGRAEIPSLERKVREILAEHSDRKSRELYRHPLLVRSLNDGIGQSFFLETVAVPEYALAEWAAAESSISPARGFAQWRVDLPDRPSALGEAECAVLSVAEKILTRGRVTLLGHELEKAILKRFPVPDESGATLPGLEQYLARTGYCRGHSPHPLTREGRSRRFFEKLLPEIFRKAHFFPSVAAGLTIEHPCAPGQNSVHRLSIQPDALIAHPRLDRAIAVFLPNNPVMQSQENREEARHQAEELLLLPLFITDQELKAGKGKSLDLLWEALQEQKSPLEAEDQGDAVLKRLLAFKTAHQIQICLVLALRHGLLPWQAGAEWTIVTDLDQHPYLDPGQLRWLVARSVRDFCNLRDRIARLYTLPDRISPPSVAVAGKHEGKQLRISFDPETGGDDESMTVHNLYFPWPLSFPASPVSLPGPLLPPDEADLTYFLRAIFRKKDLREGQYQGVCRVLQAQDTLLLLPTGSGKSLVYQLASFLLPGRTIVVDPLVALMEDQVFNLRMMGIDRVTAVSFSLMDLPEKKSVQELFADGEYLFTFVSPERLQIEEFREKLGRLRTLLPIPLVVIDECHCISEWGHDFRLAYLNIGRTAREYCRSFDRTPTLLALTGTASQSVLKDVQRELAIIDPEAVIIPRTFDRPELHFRIERVPSREKMERLQSMLKSDLPGNFQVPFPDTYHLAGTDTRSGLVFFPHVNGQYGIMENYEILSEEFSATTAFYSGKAPDLFPAIEPASPSPAEPDKRESEAYRIWKNWVTREFKKNRLSLLMVTKAFGMGIDKPNIRYTIHYGIPASIEAFYQEAVRAGRDRKPAHCWVIASNDRLEKNRQILSPDTPLREIAAFVNQTPFHMNDDITRNLFFHVHSFAGIDQEVRWVSHVLDALDETRRAGVKVIMLPNLSRVDVEKALHRLLLVGCIADYTVQYAVDSFMVDHFTVNLSGFKPAEMIESYGQYVDNYLWSRGQAERIQAGKLPTRPRHRFIEELVRLLVGFIYEVVEKGRRRALYEMVEVCAGSGNDNTVRKSLIQYLEETELSRWLNLALEDEQAGAGVIDRLAEYLPTPGEARSARGQISRRLESYPDHPGLLMARALAEARCANPNPEVVSDHVLAGLESARERYSLNEEAWRGFALEGLKMLFSSDQELTCRILDVSFPPR